MAQALTGLGQEDRREDSLGAVGSQHPARLALIPCRASGCCCVHTRPSVDGKDPSLSPGTGHRKWVPVRDHSENSVTHRCWPILQLFLGVCPKAAGTWGMTHLLPQAPCPNMPRCLWPRGTPRPGRSKDPEVWKKLVPMSSRTQVQSDTSARGENLA